MNKYWLQKPPTCLRMLLILVSSKYYNLYFTLKKNITINLKILLLLLFKKYKQIIFIFGLKLN